MKNAKKAILILLAGMLLLTACGANGNDTNSAATNNAAETKKEQVEISFSLWADKDFWQVQLDKFEELNPNIKVNFQFIPDAYEDKLFTLIAGGNPPDVMSHYETTTPDVAKKGIVEDLTPFIEKDKSFDLTDFYDVALSLSKIDGKLYGLSNTLAPQFMFYNKTAFDKANLAYPTADWTWNDYLEAAKKLTIKDGDKITQYGSDANSSWWIPTELQIRQNGGDIFKDGNANFDSPEVIQSIQFWADLNLKHHVAPSLAESSGQGDLFPSGKVAMARNGIWMKDVYKDIKDFEWDIAPLPKNKNAGTVLHTNYLTLSAKSQHKEESWELIKWLSGPEVQEALSKKQGFLPTRKSVVANKAYDTKMPASTALIGDAINYGQLLPYAPGVKQVTDEWTKVLEQVYSGAVTAEAGMKDFQPKAQATIDKNK